MANRRRPLPTPASTSTCPITSRRWRNRAGLAPTGAVGNATLVVLVPPCGYRAGCLALRPKPHCHDHGGMAAGTDPVLAPAPGLVRGRSALIVSCAPGPAGVAWGGARREVGGGAAGGAPRSRAARSARTAACC